MHNLFNGSLAAGLGLAGKHARSDETWNEFQATFRCCERTSSESIAPHVLTHDSGRWYESTVGTVTTCANARTDVCDVAEPTQIASDTATRSNLQCSFVRSQRYWKKCLWIYKLMYWCFRPTKSQCRQICPEMAAKKCNAVLQRYEKRFTAACSAISV